MAGLAGEQGALNKRQLVTLPEVLGDRNVSGNPQTDALGQVISPDMRTQAGKTLRKEVPRAKHAKWKKGQGRPDPITILQAADPERIPDLVPIRYGRMLQSPFAFYRGSAGIMAADLATTPAIGI